MLKLSTRDLQKIEEYYNTAYKAIGYRGINGFACKEWGQPLGAFAISYNIVLRSGRLHNWTLICHEKEILDFLDSVS